MILSVTMPSQTRSSASNNEEEGMREMIARLLGEELDRRLQSLKNDLVTELRNGAVEGNQNMMMARNQADNQRQNT